MEAAFLWKLFLLTVECEPFAGLLAFLGRDTVSTVDRLSPLAMSIVRELARPTWEKRLNRERKGARKACVGDGGAGGGGVTLIKLLFTTRVSAVRVSQP